MQQLTLREIIGVAVIIPVVSLVAVWTARKVGRWFMEAASRSFAQTVLDVMAPDMAHLGTKITSALDDFATTNTAEHAKVQTRLTGVEGRLTDVEARLAVVESKLQIRPPDARTRVTDREDS